jgi:brefeldin A-resistance guanine nucleotide exchange factor 1
MQSGKPVSDHEVSRAHRGPATALTSNSQLPSASLKPFLQTLLANLPEESTPRVISVKPEIPAPTPIRPNGQKVKPSGAAYQPSVVFVLELATLLVARDQETMAELGKDLAEALQGMVRDADHAHPVTLSRTVYYLLSFLRASKVSPTHLASRKHNR